METDWLEAGPGFRVKARSWEPKPSLPRGWQESNYLSHHHLLW